MLLPIGRAEERERTTAAMVTLLIFVNIIVFIMELALGDDFISGYSVVPWEISHGIDLDSPIHIRGDGYIPQAPGPVPIYLTLVTALFLHSGWLHIAGNMLYLWIFGGEIESAFGHFRFLAFYLICGIAAFGAQMVPDPDSIIPSLGASGAIAGVLGAYVRLFPHNRIRVLLPVGFVMIPVRLPALIVIGFWIVIQFFDELVSITERNAQTLNGGVAYLAHIGGFIIGMMLSMIWRRRSVEHSLDFENE